jgi:hypothetical protein
MKKTLLLTAILLGTASASLAGVHFSLGFGLPVPAVAVSVTAPPVYVAPAPVYCPPAPAYYYAPAPVYCPPRVVVAPPTFYFGCAPSWHGHRGWGYGHWHH